MTTDNTAAAARGAADPGEAEQVAYVQQLGELERAGARSRVTIGPYSLFTTIGALQLVLRHPDLPDSIRSTLTELIGQWRAPFDGTLGESIITRGFDPDADQPAVMAGEVPMTGKWWACKSCHVYWDATGYDNPQTCGTCGGPMVLTADADAGR